MSNVTNTTQYIPWDWVIQSTNPKANGCPPSSRILGTFAWVNLVVSILAALVGHQGITIYFTNLLFFWRRAKKSESDLPLLEGGEAPPKTLPKYKKPSHAYYWTWLFPFGLQLGANALNAYIMQRAEGYRSTYSLLEMTLFMTLRPRLGIVFIAFLDFIFSFSSTSEYHANNPYRLAAISSMFSEMALQAIAVYTTGSTIRFVSKTMFFGTGDGPKFRGLPYGAKMMYAGAVTHLLAFSNIGLCFIIVVRHMTPENEWHQGKVWKLFLFSLFFPYVASWIYLAGYIRLAGDSFCPPSLGAQGGIWAGFSALGMILGSTGG